MEDEEIEKTICKCGDVIHPYRLQCGYKTCVKCSTTKGYVGVTEFGHKTAGYVVKIDPNVNEEGVRRAWRAYHRSR